MTQSLFRPAIIVPVSLVILVVIALVIGNLFDIQVRPKSSEKKDDPVETAARNTESRPPRVAQPPARDGQPREHPFPTPPTLPENMRPQLRPTPPQFFAPHENLMTDLGIPDALKAKAVDVLKSFDAEMKQHMQAALKGEPPPSPEVFREMEERRNQNLREVLGESQYQAYSENVDTIPERAAISSLQSRLERAGLALNEDQSGKLLQAMVEGARSQNPTEGAAHPGPAGRMGAVDNRFQSASEALREASSELSEAHQVEINRFIEETVQMRSQMRRPR